MAVMWTAWICVASLLEERDLIAEFGDRYRRYREQVPILIPWKGWVRVDVDTVREVQRGDGHSRI